jgi:DegV family protein with EDD domain
MTNADQAARGENLMDAQPAHVDRPPVILTDTACDLPPAAFHDYPIHVIPQKIFFGEETFRSGIDMTVDQFFERLAQSSTLPTTQPATEEEFAQKYTELGADGTPILSIHISTGLSEMTLIARRAARQCSSQVITIWDSKMASGGMGLQVLTAARAIKAGYTIDEIIPLLEQTYHAGNMYFCLNDLNYLYRGGRIGRVSYHVAQTLRLKPIITVSKAGQTTGTYVTGAERPYTMQAAVDALVRHVAIDITPHSKMRAMILYSGKAVTELVKQLDEKLRDRFDCVYLEILPIAPVLSVHTGPGALGIAYVVGDWPV